ncbi:MAG TPA: hypothetical protein V6C90_26810 [Coleofasciculaceae cyanobacterium]
MPDCEGVYTELPPYTGEVPLKSRVKEAHSRLQKAKFWDDLEKQKQLEKLLQEMEALLADE